MYVEIDSTSLMSTTPTEVFVYLTFLVYNKKEKKYSAIHDVEVKRFNPLRTVWGMPQVLSSDIFNNPNNGYIFDGEQCEFGVDVMVVSPFTKWEVASFNKAFPKFSWSVKNFSKLKKEYHLSKQFSVRDRNWVLELYPNGLPSVAGKWLSFYLTLANNETLMAGEKIYVRGHLRVLDPQGSNHNTKACILNNLYEESSKRWGNSRFLSLAKLRETYLDKDDSLNVEIEFDVVSETKYSPIF